MIQPLHYAIVKCSCGARPDGSLSDAEACDSIIRHIAAMDEEQRILRSELLNPPPLETT
jgi:hypothetical protein